MIHKKSIDSIYDSSLLLSAAAYIWYVVTSSFTGAFESNLFITVINTQIWF